MRNISSLNRKGQVGNLAPAILSLVFAAIVLVFGIIMSESLGNIDAIKVSKSVTNESGGASLGATVYINGTNYTLAKENGEKTKAFTITAVWANWNQSNGSQVAITATPTTGYNVSLVAANYTGLYTDTGVLNNHSIALYAFPNVSISYTYLDGDYAYEGANNTTHGLGTFADFWEIIVLAIVITIVIGLLLAVFGGRRAR